MKASPENPEHPRIRIDEDGTVDVAITPEEFDQRVRDLLAEDHIKDLPAPIDRVVYWRDDLPQRRIWVDCMWWAIALIAGVIFLYGLFSIAEKCLSARIPSIKT